MLEDIVQLGSVQLGIGGDADQTRVPDAVERGHIIRLVARNDGDAIALRKMKPVAQGARDARGPSRQCRVIMQNAVAEPDRGPVRVAVRGRFEMLREETSTDPVLLDYLDLLARGRTPSRAPIVLSQYGLSESSAHGGSLYLEVRGPDRVGFLGALLERLSFLSLAPVEMRIETLEDGVHDQFWLRARGGALPRPRARKLLAEVMDGRLLR